MGADREAGAAQAGGIGKLYLLDPFLLGAPSLSSLDLAALLPKLSGFATAEAGGIATDSSATAIALWQTHVPAAITFKVGAGLTLRPYRKTFLNERPTKGARRLTVQPSSFFRIGQNLYAAALVQGPLSYATPVPARATVTAMQGLVEGKATLDLVPAPILFVHGLWGDAGSLSKLDTYLSQREPWKSRGQLRTFAYPRDLRFNHPNTIATVAGVINEELANLDNRHIVGGRVDAIAHSMGGLVLRSFSTSKGYLSLRSRRLGKLGQVVTLDTPQLGSELATFLIDHRNDRARRPSVVWSFACGLDPKTTVGQCLEDNDMPIWGPIRGSPNGGAVKSLFPTNPALARTPGLNTINALRWTNVTAVLRSSDDSTLLYVLTELLRAISHDAKHAPTPTTILGGPNDAVVSRPSQSSGSNRLNTALFFGLAHSDFFGPANEAVVNSQRVFAYAACRLKRPAVNCVPRANPSAEELSATRGSGAGPEFGTFRVLALEAPAAAQIASPMEVGAPIGAARIERVIVTQRNNSGDRAGGQQVRFDASGGTLRFSVTPRLLGRVTFTVAVYRSDHNIAVDKLVRNVTAPPGQPIALLGDNPYHNVHVPVGSERLLTASGEFAGLDESVPLTGKVSYLVLAGAQNIRLEGNRLTGVQVGTARIEARMGSAADVMTVTVDP